MITCTIIIPVLNEAESIAPVIESAKKNQGVEILVVDGGSNDTTRERAAAAGATVIRSQPGKARQMNKGAMVAQGHLLLFLHGDTLLPENSCQLISNALKQHHIAGGAFSLQIATTKTALKWIAAGANLRSNLLQLPYGDQALFTTKELFRDTGGFPEIPIMEDYIFIRRLAKKGKIIILPETVITSDRRWEHMGIIKTTMINQLMIIGFNLGVAPEKLSRIYQRARGKGEKPDV